MKLFLTEAIKCSYVFVDNVLYYFDSPLEAMDGCFKIAHALHAEYPDDCEPVWNLLQIYVYKITTKWDKSFTSVSSIISDLNK